MKIIREHINEKFKEESDPIHDLNIGIPFKKGDVVKYKKQFETIQKHERYRKIAFYDRGGLNYNVRGIVLTHKIIKNKLFLELAFFGDDDMFDRVINVILPEGGVDEIKDRYVVLYGEGTFDEWKEFLIKIGTTYIAESLNEKFQSESDPIEDLGIGSPYVIKDQLDKLQLEKGVTSIRFVVDDKLKKHRIYYVEVFFTLYELPNMIKTFYKHIDRKYIDNEIYLSIGSLRTIIGFIIKPEYAYIFRKAFDLLF